MSLKFKDICTVTSIGHLKIFLNGLKDPTNALEQEAVDLLNARIEELSAVLEALKKADEEKARQERLSKLKRRRK